MPTAVLQTGPRDSRLGVGWGGTDGSGRKPRVLLSWKTANENPLEGGGEVKGGEGACSLQKQKAEVEMIGWRWKGFG